MESSARQRKRKWFESKYGPTSSNSGIEDVICKFYASSGSCRNGDSCKFLHQTPASSKITQPCKFLYTPPFRCLKGDHCHFSHECSLFPCPFMNISRGLMCRPSCGFDHSLLVSESQRIAFVKTYHSLLSSLTGPARVAWQFYLNEGNDDFLEFAYEDGIFANFFMVSNIGGLNQASWNRCAIE